MDYLTVKELAELKGCSGQYIRKQIAVGAINADQVVNEANGHTSYLIPFLHYQKNFKQNTTYKSGQKQASFLKKLNLSSLLKNRD